MAEAVPTFYLVEFNEIYQSLYLFAARFGCAHRWTPLNGATLSVNESRLNW